MSSLFWQSPRTDTAPKGRGLAGPDLTGTNYSQSTKARGSTSSKTNPTTCRGLCREGSGSTETRLLSDGQNLTAFLIGSGYAEPCFLQRVQSRTPPVGFVVPRSRSRFLLDATASCGRSEECRAPRVDHLTCNCPPQSDRPHLSRLGSLPVEGASHTTQDGGGPLTAMRGYMQYS